MNQNVFAGNISDTQIKLSTPEIKAAETQAAVFKAPGVIEIAEIPMPEPAPDEVRIKLEGCGICASNLPVWEGREWFRYPFEPGSPGHEGWGIIDKTGSNVRELHTGDRVAALSYHAYARYDIAKADSVLRLPDSLNGKAFPGEPLGCAMNIFRRSRIEKGMTVAVIGIGFLGALLTNLAANAGARVIAVSRRGYSLELAKRYGADVTIALDDYGHVIGEVNDITNNAGCDRVIECAGKQVTLSLAGEITKVRGLLIIAGYHQEGSRQVNMQMWNWRGIDVINAHERDPEIYIQGIKEAIAAVARGELDPSRLFTHSFNLNDISHGFQILAERPEGFMKALVIYE